MNNITLIAAIGKNNELGLDNKLIWYLPDDLKFFKEQTMNKPIVMGINTLHSLPKLLPNRRHIVLTHQDIEIDGVEIYHSKEELIEYIRSLNEEVMVIGGASIYKQMIDEADKMVLTRVEKEAPADAFFPKINESDWNIKEVGSNEYNDIKFKHLIYKRK